MRLNPQHAIRNPLPKCWKGYEHRIGHPFDEKLESKSPRDDEGHGTHTSTIADSSTISGAKFLGYAFRTARGMVHATQVATHKVLSKCCTYGSDILVGIDKAIKDEVHILFLSFA
ncbi:Peptidase S8, subtilisin-related [Parasponia andersonii]|uniref:Peptidase S8, subtilisin-related n=1 Tax=Parasponia andersonii TaxID=3476 RepID=A0A2P5A5N5_PARAD|nr:Peptidase S8, subtilisin-related [Parasponia andersonii]